MKDPSIGGTEGLARRISMMGMLVALSVLLVYLIHVPLFPAVPFLKYDPADIPVLVGGFAFGPRAGLLMAIATSVIQGLMMGGGGGVYGILMHTLATGTLVVVATLSYRRQPTRRGAAYALVCGGVAMTGIMIPANYLVTPLFLGVDMSAVTPLIGYITLFNLLKSGLNGLLTWLLYKKISFLIKG